MTREWPEHRVAWSYLARCQRRSGDQRSASVSLKKYRSLQRSEDTLEAEHLLSQIEALRR